MFYWIYRKKKLFLISLTAILLGWTHLSNFFTLNLNAEETDKATFSMISYNVRLFDLYDWTKSKGIKDKIFYFLQDESPDVVCFQEFYSKQDSSGNSSKKRLVRDLKTKNAHVSYVKKRNRTYNYGTATFSKYPIVGKGEIPFKNSNNQCIYTDIQAGKQTIRIYNSHLESVHFGYDNYQFLDSLDHKIDNRKIRGLFNILKKLNIAFKKRAAQVEIIYQHVQNSPYPVIICGDFNDTPISYAYHRMCAGLNDAFITSGIGIGSTYIRRLFPYRIDYILHSDTLKSSGFRRYKEKLSDHYPIGCRFSIAE